MRKTTMKWMVAILVLGALVVLWYTPLGYRIKAYAGGIYSDGAALLKSELQLSLKNYQWKLVDLQGNDFDFETQKGSVVLINFWASWCAPCVAEMPSLQELYKDYGDKVAFLMVAQDKQEKVAAFIKKKGYTFPVYFSQTAAPPLLTSKTIPTTYILDKKGKIRVSETNAVDWNNREIRKIVEKLLTEQ